MGLLAKRGALHVRVGVLRRRALRGGGRAPRCRPVVSMDWVLVVNAAACLCLSSSRRTAGDQCMGLSRGTNAWTIGLGRGAAQGFGRGSKRDWGLVQFTPEIQKVFKISGHIESCGTCMEY